MKKSEEDRLKCVVYESTRAPLRGPPSPMGKAAIRGYRFSRHNAFPKGESKEEAASPQKKEGNPASLRSAAPSKGRGSRGHFLLPMEGGAPKGEARRYIANDFLNLIALPQGGRLNRQRLRREYIGGDARRSANERIPVLNFPNIAHLPANDKDVSLRSK